MAGREEQAPDSGARIIYGPPFRVALQKVRIKDLGFHGRSVGPDRTHVRLPKGVFDFFRWREYRGGGKRMVCFQGM